MIQTLNFDNQVIWFDESLISAEQVKYAFDAEYWQQQDSERRGKKQTRGGGLVPLPLEKVVIGWCVYFCTNFENGEINLAGLPGIRNHAERLPVTLQNTRRALYK